MSGSRPIEPNEPLQHTSPLYIYSCHNKHTHILMYVHTYTHVLTHVYTHMPLTFLAYFIQPKLVTHIHTHTHTHTHVHTRTHVRTHAHTHARTHTYPHVRTHLKLVESTEVQHSCTIRAHVVPTTRTIDLAQTDVHTLPGRTSDGTTPPLPASRGHESKSHAQNSP